MISELSPLGFLLAGVAATGHCSVMCGPLVLANNQYQAPAAARWLLVGRLLAYAIFGVFAVLLGQQLSLKLVPNDLLVVRSLVLVLAVGMAAWWVFQKQPSHAHCHRRARASTKVLHNICKGLGLAFIPCPLLFSVLLYSSLLSSPLMGALCLVAFGTGSFLLPTLVVSKFHTSLSSVLFNQRQTGRVGLLVIALGTPLLFSQWLPAWACW